MKIKLAKYAAKLLAEHGITRCFSVTGGGAMHLNDGIGHNPAINTLYMHHEQACAIAAESYARIYNKPALLCVTTGPGGTNAITGVLGAWLDSIPMIVLSGQVRYDNTARWSGVGIRAMGDQEFDITRSIDCMTKYSKMLLNPMQIRYELEKCLYLSQTGRPGPCWLDIPVDIQGVLIDEDTLPAFDPEAYEREQAAALVKLAAEENTVRAAERDPYANEQLNDRLLNIAFKKQRLQPPPSHITKDSPVVQEIIERVKAAKRPVFYTGNGIRIAGAETLFLAVADRLGIPVVVGWNGVDIIPGMHPLKAGQPGGRGDRPGNFAVQNADLILAVGSRLNIRQVGYNFKTWAREAYTIVCDIDAEELKKPSVHTDLAIHADARELLAALLLRLEELGYEGHKNAATDAKRLLEEGYHTGGSYVFQGGEGLPGMNWWETCAHWMRRYSVYQDKFAAFGSDEPVNVYEFFDRLSRALSENQITVVGNGSACVAGGQAYLIKDGTRFISQDAVAAMGYDLPAAIGACVACHAVSEETLPVDETALEMQETEDSNAALQTVGDAAEDVSLAGGPADSLSEQQLLDKAFALGELNAAQRNPYWTGRKEHYPPYYAHDIICPTGDGSIMMNLQELQTIISHRMPIKIFLINNGGYHSIRQTQHNLFAGEPLVGIGIDSFDLSFPSFEKLAAAFGFPYVRAAHNTELDSAIAKTLAMKGPVICEVIVSLDQAFEPRSAVKRHADGSLSSPPLEDLCPFLSEEEFAANMIVKPVVE